MHVILQLVLMDSLFVVEMGMVNSSFGIGGGASKLLFLYFVYFCYFRFACDTFCFVYLFVWNFLESIQTTYIRLLDTHFLTLTHRTFIFCTRILQKYHAHDKGPSIGCVWHPALPSTVFTCGWDGVIKMWE